MDYLFGQVSIDSAFVDWSGNCGNLSTAVGPFAIANGFIDKSRLPQDGTFAVRVWQANIGKTIIAHVPMRDGEVQETGDFELDGVAFPAAEIVLALQSMVTRRVDVFDPAVVTVAHLQAGSTNNVIPESAFLEGTIRTLSAQRRADVVAAVQRVATHVAAAHELGVEFDHQQGYPVTVNDADAAARVLATTRELLGEQAAVVLPAPLMGAEDFSYVLQEVPGALAWLGARPPGVDPADAPPNHSNLVVFDEEPLPAGAALYARMALEELSD